MITMLLFLMITMWSDVAIALAPGKHHPSEGAPKKLLRNDIHG